MNEVTPITPRDLDKLDDELLADLELTFANAPEHGLMCKAANRIRQLKSLLENAERERNRYLMEDTHAL